jgi:hypothetical protein
VTKYYWVMFSLLAQDFRTDQVFRAGQRVPIRHCALPPHRVCFAELSTSLAPLQAWLIDEGRRQPDVPMAMKGLGARLEQAGFDPLRINLQLRTLHPLVATQMHIWQRLHVAKHSLSREAYVIEQEESSFEDALVQKVDLAHGAFESASFRKSPIFLLYEGVARHVRRRIPTESGELEPAGPRST